MNENLSERGDQQHGAKSGLLQTKIRRMTQTGGIKRKFHRQGGTDVLLIPNICPCIVERKSSDASRSNGPGRVRTSSRDAD